MILKNERLHIVGTSATITGTSSNLLLVTTDMAGENPEYRQYNLIDKMEGMGFDITSDGGYVFTGGSTTGSDSEIVIAKTKPGGEF